jgi:hypothetical protein
VGGIIGKLSFERDETLAHPVLEQMLDALRHRGANNHGIHTAPGIALGWRGEVAADAAGTIHVVADGDDGCAQLILDSYVESGDRCMEQMHRPFACAVWDSRRGRLLLARDHTGRRPLYFAFLHGHGIVFASEIGALLKDPGVGREWCALGVDAYLTHGYVPAPLTIYRRISKLEPAHRLVVEGRRLQIERYWSPAALDSAPDDGAAEFERELTRAVSEQPVAAGILYSGGPASAALLACAGRSRPLHRVALTVGLDQDTHDLARSHAAAGLVGVDPIIEVATLDAPQVAADLAARLEEPTADPSVIAHYSVFLTARAYMDDAIAGHGGAALSPNPAEHHGPWPADDRFAIYTRGFALDVRNAGPADFHDNPVRADVPALVERIAHASGLSVGLPYMDRSVTAVSAICGDASPLRGLLSRYFGGGIEVAPAARHPWLRSALRTMVPSLLLGERFDGRGIVSRPALRTLWEEHRLGRRDHSLRLWSLLMLELWFREFIDGGVAEAPLEYAFSRAA